MREHKERFWNEVDEVMQSITKDERVVIGADFNGHVGEDNRGDEAVTDRFGIQDRNPEGQMVVDFEKRMGMAAVNTCSRRGRNIDGLSEWREEHSWRLWSLKEISDCKEVGESRR